MKTVEPDFETEDELIDEFEREPLKFWEKKQRELVTSVVDYNLSTLTDLVLDGTINVSPTYQRRFRWPQVKQSLLMESFLMNVPVPPIFLNEDEYGTYSVIDGKQRLIAIREFLMGRLILKDLEIFSDINGLSFDGLPRELQRVIKTRPTLRAIVILRQSDPDIKFEVFRRLNTGGVKLNAQEIRNSAYPGPLNDLILSLSDFKRFHSLLHIKDKVQSSIYQEMRDAEFVLRFFTFKDNWADFPGGMRRQMDQFMYKNQHASEKRIIRLKTTFLNTIEVVEAAFANHSFVRWLPEKGKWKKQVLASLYDAEMFACTHFTVQQVKGRETDILEGMKGLFDNDDFRKAIDAATNAPASFRSRISMVRDVITEAVSN